MCTGSQSLIRHHRKRTFAQRSGTRLAIQRVQRSRQASVEFPTLFAGLYQQHLYLVSATAHTGIEQQAGNPFHQVERREFTSQLPGHHFAHTAHHAFEKSHIEQHHVLGKLNISSIHIRKKE